MKKATGILMACVALTFGVGTMAACKPEEPEVTEGAIYVTEAKSFWAGVGSGYLSFEYKEEPQEPVEGERYGYVFHVMVDSGDGYSSYMSGNWELEGEEGSYGTLTLTGYWDASIENPTMLDGAESGVAKEYEPTDSKYTIGVSIPSAGVLDFTLDPVANKVGEGETPGPDEPDEPDTPCTEHVDEDGDGKCDVCGEDMPTEQPSEGEVQLTLKAEASIEPFEGYTVTAEAKIELYTDNTWVMSVKTDANPSQTDYVEAASGTWALDMTTYAMTLTVTEETMEDSLPETFVVNCDISGYPELAYSAEVDYTSAGFTFEFSFAESDETEPEPEPEPEPGPEPEPEPGEDELRSEVAEFWGGVGKAYIGFDTEAGTFSINVDAGTGYGAWLSGEYTLSADTLTLTAEWTEGANSTYLADAVSGEPKEYAVNNGTYVIGVVLPSAGTVNFKFVPDPDAVQAEEHYTVTFDFLNGTTVQVKTSTFEAEDGTKKQYIPAVSAPATYNGDAPYVLGKRFAGWDTSKEPVLVDGVSSTKFLLDVNSNSYFDVGAIEKDVMEVTEDMTVYARWVEPQWVETEEDLRNMKNDLSGWYILKNDITLTEEWMPVGAYYATYEYLSASWWTYAFSGQLDGNGYSIKGLKISTLEPYGDTVHPTEGSGNGTTALFGSVCNAEITDLVIESPVIDIKNYSNAKHGYVAVVAAFAQQSPKIVNVHVVDAKISVKTTDVNYIAVCAFVGGHWGGTVSRCSATGTIDVSVNFTEGYEGGSTNLYVGGIAGEGYGWIDETSSEMDITLTVNDARAELPPSTDPTTGMPASVTNNVYMGSIGGSTTYTDNVTAGGSVTLDYANVENTLVVAYLGGIGGIQRYGYLDYSETDTQISVKTNQAESNMLYVGSLLGGYDAITSIINLQGFNDLKARQCTDRGVSYALNTAEQTVDFIGYAPKTAEEMMVATIVAQAMGIDLSPYVDADGNYTIYGTDRCERVNG